MSLEAHVRRVNEDYFGVPLGPHKYPLVRWKDWDFTTDQLLFNARRGGNLAVRAGLTRKGIQVLCIDRDDRRRGSWDLLRRHGLQRANCQVETASGNWHLWFRLEREIAELRTRIRLLSLPIDVKATGIVVYPYSRLGGGVYDFRTGRAYKPPEELTVLPESFLELLLARPAPQAAAPVQTTGNRYADAALRYEAQKVAAAAEGTRNATLNRAAFCLGQLVAVGVLTREAVETALTGAALSVGLPAAETAATIKSGLAAGLKRPRNLARTSETWRNGKP